MTSFATKPFARSLTIRTPRPRTLRSPATFTRSVVDPYRAAAAHERGLAAAIAGAWPLLRDFHRTID